MTDNTNDSALTKDTLFDGAKMYASASDAVNDKLPNSFHVLSHLLCTSIELALKSYLVHVGYPEKKLRKIGHDLSNLFETCHSEGFEYTGSRNFVLAVSGEIYKQRLFVYPENSTMNVITPRRLRQMTDEIINEVFIAIYPPEVKNIMDTTGMTIDSEYIRNVDASNWFKKST
jgi:hypothetical protein